MKRLLIYLFFSVFALTAAGQGFPSTDSLRIYNIKYITNNPNTAFTNYRLNTLLRGMIDWIDTARTGGNASIGIDTIGVLNDSTIRYRKNGVWTNKVIKGVYDSRRKVDSVIVVNDTTLRFIINGANRDMNIVGRNWDLQGILDNGSTLTQNSTITLLDSLHFASGSVGFGDTAKFYGPIIAHNLESGSSSDNIVVIDPITKTIKQVLQSSIKPSLTNTRVAFGNSSNEITDDANFTFNITSKKLTVGATTIGSGTPGSNWVELGTRTDGVRTLPTISFYNPHAPVNNRRWDMGVGSEWGGSIFDTIFNISLRNDAGTTLAIPFAMNRSGDSINLITMVSKSVRLYGQLNLVNSAIIEGPVRIHSMATGSSGDSVVVKASDGTLKTIKQVNVSSGTYTPTLTNIANIDGSTAISCMYTRVGNVVTVSGAFQIDATSDEALTEIGISLPIPSDFSAITNLSGHLSCPDFILTFDAISADVSNDRAYFKGLMSSTELTYFFTFTYIVQ